ncbi:NAD(P)H-dependent glycerol-3-phosphate dehydrogenase [Candidatus Lokiarchaeum ossiferum]|uniref:NAD(P)H-dependent glycerol-3-phosphate dehydrogenase n=1 Tax=Candidatus Lokiarchaeum ossiferum TaxID=2951803 RepID=UPI00352D79FF
MVPEISVIGAGGWGTTLGNLLATKGFLVKIWSYEQETVDSINNYHENVQFLPSVKLSSDLIAFSKFEEVIPNAEILVFAVPSSHVRKIAEQISPFFKNDQEYKLVSVSKGLEYTTFKLMSEVLREVLPSNVKVAALSGPNLSSEVAHMQPTATVIASIHEEILPELVDLFHTAYFKPYAITDERGIEICGAVKNITAIAVGFCDGLNLGNNSKGSIMTLGLHEMNRIGKHFGCTRGTFFGIAGIGDLIATCSSKLSRNHFYGEEIARGKTLEQIRDEMHGMVAEGVWAAESIYQFAQENDIDLPLTTQVYKVLHEGKLMEKAIKDLLALI